MLRLVGFLVLAVLLANLLGRLPVIGPVFARTGCLGVWISAMLLSWAFTRWGERAWRIRRDSSQMRQLEAVDSPHTHGKLGTLLLNQGRTRRAVGHLERAAQGEPDVAEWHYRLGTARLARRDAEGAARSLERCLALDEEHAYGAAAMRLAEARTRSGDFRGALDALATLERNHGPSPESAYRRGVAHKALGEKAEASRALDEVAALARGAARYQKKSAVGWTLRASAARLL